VFSCRYDFVELRDGGSINSPTLGKYCGNTQPAGVISSTGQAMFIRFRTDSSAAHSGFKAAVNYGQFFSCTFGALCILVVMQ